MNSPFLLLSLFFFNIFYTISLFFCNSSLPINPVRRVATTPRIRLVLPVLTCSLLESIPTITASYNKWELEEIRFVILKVTVARSTTSKKRHRCQVKEESANSETQWIHSSTHYYPILRTMCTSMLKFSLVSLLLVLVQLSQLVQCQQRKD